MKKNDYMDFSLLDNPNDYGFENTKCYFCGSDNFTVFEIGQDDLTGKPGNFRFVKCTNCGLAYQNPRIVIDQIKDFYDDNYIAHRKKGIGRILTPLYNWAFSKHDRDKIKIISKFITPGPGSEVIDIGCAAGSFLLALKDKYGTSVSGVDFKDFSKEDISEKINMHCGLFYEQDFGGKKFDLVTMWHFLEHCYDPMRSLAKTGEILKDDGVAVIEVPRLDSLTYKLFGSKWPGLQAPQHTVLFDKKMFLKTIEKSGLRVVEYLPYGAFPAYFYIYTGLVFKLTNIRGINIKKHAVPYFIGQALLLPFLIFEKKLNLSMQTVVCKKA